MPASPESGEEQHLQGSEVDRCTSEKKKHIGPSPNLESTRSYLGKWGPSRTLFSWGHVPCSNVLLEGPGRHIPTHVKTCWPVRKPWLMMIDVDPSQQKKPNDVLCGGPGGVVVSFRSSEGE